MVSRYEVHSKWGNKTRKPARWAWNFSESPELSCGDESLFLLLLLLVISYFIFFRSYFDSLEVVVKYEKEGEEEMNKAKMLCRSPGFH